MSLDPQVIAAALIAREEMPPDKGEPGVDGQNGVDGINGMNGRDGINGKDGINGTDGRDGVDGKDGASIHLGSGEPPIGLGQPGDAYIDVESGDLWRL